MVEENKNSSNKSSKKKPEKDLLKQLDLSHLNDSFVHVKVGNDDLPATDADIQNVDEQLTELFEDNNVNCLLYVSHHAVDIKVVSSKK